MMSTVYASGAGASIYDVTTCASQPLKPAKKYRPEDDGDKQIVRCKRKLDFVANEVDDRGTAKSGGRRDRGGGSGSRRAASIARRNERERKRVSLINRTFETLRDQLPSSLWGHRNLAKVSKVETLRAAIGYIRTLEDLLATDDAGGEEDGHLVDVLSSAERLASLSGHDRRLDTPHVSSSPRLQLSKHTVFHAPDAAASACERLEHLSSCAPPTHVDLHSATRRLARLTAPDQNTITQQHFYDMTTGLSLSGRQPLQTDDDSLPFLDINSNYDNARQLSLKPVDDDVICQLVNDNFIFDNDDLSATVAS